MAALHICITDALNKPFLIDLDAPSNKTSDACLNPILISKLWTAAKLVAVKVQNYTAIILPFKRIFFISP